MLPLPVKIINSLALALSNFYIVKNLVGKNTKISKLSIIVAMILLILPSCILFDVKYNTLVSLLTYIISILVYKKIFKLNIGASIFASSFAMILVSVVDVVLCCVEILIVSYEQVQSVWYISLINNILISTLAYLLSCLNVLKKVFENISKKIKEQQQIITIIFEILLVVVIAILYINITSIFELNIYYVVTTASIIIFFFLYYFYMKEKNNYEKLNDEYNTVFEYVQNFENWIDDEQMYRHELKNNLAMIREMTKEKNVKNKIDDMLKMSIIVDDQYVEQLKNIPKGGLKGLLYYKIAIASNNKVNMVAEVSSKVTKKIEKLTTEQLRQICILLGIYLDNAIEASSLAKNKLVTLEVYSLEEQVHFVISNTYANKVPLEQIKKKGYSTKGKNRGKGLHYAQKVVNKNKYLNADNIFLNDFYIQKLIIN